MPDILPTVWHYVLSVWHMATEAAPWLVIGLVAAAVVKAWAPKGFISRRLGGRGARGVLEASVIGIPLPLCSCGVLPTALGLRRQGASKPSTVSFLVSTPEIGLDSIALSYALLGPVMAVARPVAALCSAVAAGLATVFVNRRVGDAEMADRVAEPAGGADAPDACCGSPPAPPSHGEPHGRGAADARRAVGAEGDAEAEAGRSSCCGDGGAGAASGQGAARDAAAEPIGVWAKLGEGMGYVFSKLLDDIKWWLAIAIVVAGLLMGYFEAPAETLEAITTGVWAPVGMLAMALIGVPLYVCATGSTPLAAGLLAAGVSPGTVLVLLLAGPATNLGAVAILKRELGLATVVTYLATIVLASIAAGLGLDAVIGAAGWRVVGQAGEHGRLIPESVGVAAVVLLTALAVPPVRRLVGWGLSGMFGRGRQPAPASAHDPIHVAGE